MQYILLCVVVFLHVVGHVLIDWWQLIPLRMTVIFPQMYKVEHERLV